ncbi:hypothetical protein OCF84_21795 (plasmid) [Shewanella xiamenensis]|uniref:Uncharacterized protein n=1 Tax=Shewanella xiamenensis TaxID=332186 RepID=A0ABT6UDE1_9GAMM|nr:hypothetical protein [Shewanella xiamenensis]MDI5832487.1 hypothetical protein [Shewanella xiamenensis]WHF57894.1 hypothetical protein OCF84_21795 [Shewanella xiamenensis]
MQITPDELKIEIIYSVQNYSEAYLSANRELSRMNEYTGDVQYLDRYIHGLNKVIFQAVKKLIGEIPFLSDDRFKKLISSEFFTISSPKKSCMNDVSGFIPLMTNLSNAVSLPLVIKLINCLNDFYPFDRLSSAISDALEKFFKEESFKPLRRFFVAEEAEVKESGINFTFNIFSVESTYVAFDSLDNALAKVSEECGFNFGGAIKAFTESTLFGSQYAAGNSFGSSKGTLSSHIKLKTFKKHIRLTLSHAAFEAILAYMLTSDDVDTEDCATSLIELISEA